MHHFALNFQVCVENEPSSLSLSLFSLTLKNEKQPERLEKKQRGSTKFLHCVLFLCIWVLYCISTRKVELINWQILCESNYTSNFHDIKWETAVQHNHVNLSVHTHWRNILAVLNCCTNVFTDDIWSVLTSRIPSPTPLPVNRMKRWLIWLLCCLTGS